MTEKVERANRKIRQGIVVSDKMNKGLVVRVDRTMRHSVYGKTFRTFSKLYVHDENNEAHEGDVVRVMETRPLSATKRWRLIEIVERAK